MEYRELGEVEYERKLRTVIVGTEGLHPHVQDVGDRRATIGWGYTLNRDNNVQIWRASGIELTEAQWQTLAAVDAAPRADKTRIGLTFTRQLDEGQADRLFRASVPEYERPAIAAGMPLSDERIAMVSVTYNRGVGAMRDHPVNDAIADGDRAEAWYQLRYNCWGTNREVEGGLRKRRFAEAEVFSLYDDAGNVSPGEAADVYEMYRSHRAEIDRVEQAFGVSLEGVEARPNRVAQANRDYMNIVAEYGAVGTIAESLEPARAVLLEHLRTEYPAHAREFSEASFNAGAIDLVRYPVRQQEVSEQVHPRDLPAQDPAHVEHRAAGGDERELMPHVAPSNDMALDRYLAAVMAGDSAAADRAATEFARSAEGSHMAEQGDQWLAQHQAAEHAQAQERQMAR